VEDNGPGIPPEDLPRVFDPFFTSKESDRAMGMGFWICREVVADHGGEILVESDGRSGTRVTLRLPVARQAEEGRTGADGFVR
jgi:signal transduction histidine kinase